MKKSKIKKRVLKLSKLTKRELLQTFLKKNKK